MISLAVVSSAATAQTRPRLEISAPRALVDEPLRIRVIGVGAGKAITIRAEFRDDLGQTWRGWAQFAADRRGTVDLQSAVPRGGTYQTADAMGLFWSMEVVDGPGDWVPFAAETTQSLAPLLVTLTASKGDSTVASATAERVFLRAGVGQSSVREDGLVATWFRPPGPGPHRAALVMGGSNGGFGWAHQIAALLASRGRAALAVAYFDWAGRHDLPNRLVEIPLEYFQSAVRYLARQPGIDLTGLAVIGISKGGELALLLGATLPEITHVVGYVPSAVVWEGIGLRPPEEPRSSWTWRGVPLPFVPSRPDEEFYRTLDRTRLRGFHEIGLQDREAVARAAIPVENVGGPVLVISGTRDSVWPSAEMADMVQQRLANGGWPVTHLRIEGAGHAIGVPYLPTSRLDGDPVTNARADRHAWRAVLRFLTVPDPVSEEPER